MGINALQSLFSTSTPLLTSNLSDGTRGASSAASEPATASPSTETGLVSSGTSGAEQAYEAMVYTSRVRQATLAAQFQAVRAQASDLTDASGEGVTATSDQLKFDFFGSVRSEEQALFVSRTNAAADGMEGTQREQFLGVRQSLEARFQMSATFSGVALSAFSKGAEGLMGSDSGSFDQFLGLVNDLMDSPDDAAQRIFEMLDGFFSGTGSEDSSTPFAALLQQAYGLLGAPASTNGSATQTTGQTQSITMQMEFKFEFSFSASVTTEQTVVQQSDPIVLDLDGDGVELTHYADGARFDITGKGQTAATAFVTGGDAFLAVDRNANGRIDSGLELFGDQRGASNGFEELRAFDSNADNVIDAKDKDFDKLLLFRDNGNGVTDEGELISLADAGIESISLGYRNVNQAASGANRIAQTSWFRRQDGSSGVAADAVLNFTA